jgi:hypothetical protein
VAAARADCAGVYGAPDGSGAAVGDVQAAADWRVSRRRSIGFRCPSRRWRGWKTAIRAEITSLWQTDEVRSRRPTVYDEVKMGLDYYDVSIFATLPSLYREIAEALRAAYGLEMETLALPQVLMLRLVDRRRPRWQSLCDAGGDARRDPAGAGHLLLYYQRRLDEIIDLLTTSAQQIGVSEALLARLRLMWRWCIRPRRRSLSSSTSSSITGDLHLPEGAAAADAG